MKDKSKDVISTWVGVTEERGTNPSLRHLSSYLFVWSLREQYPWEFRNFLDSNFFLGFFWLWNFLYSKIGESLEYGTRGFWGKWRNGLDTEFYFDDDV